MRRQPNSMAFTSPTTRAIEPVAVKAAARLKPGQSPPSEGTNSSRDGNPKTGSRQFTVIVTAGDGIPFATSTSVFGPVSMPAGTSKFVETIALPVATPMVLWS
jgi:hypothetical protein